MSTPAERATKAAYMRRYYAALPPERKAAIQEAARLRRLAASPEKKAEQLAYNRVYINRPGKRAANAEHMRKWRASLTTEQLASRADRLHAQARARRAANPVKFLERDRRNAPKAREKRIAELERIAGRPTSTVCDICGKSSDRRLHFDHDHETNLFRGWLCWRCNLTLGKVEDDTELLQEMIDYLVRSRRPRLVFNA